MRLPARHLLLGLAAIITTVGMVWLVRDARSVSAWFLLVGGLAIVGAGAIVGATRPTEALAPPESEDIRETGDVRRRELVRGTSLYLREMRYRYSIRFDASDAADRKPFSAEVNSIKLGFVPVIIIDNTNDRQGFGYAAFVHDGKRWRGPGLPCPAGQNDAVKHAARCVSPLAKDEETKF